ncbi:DUF4349 domain-containing protein [Mucilaginibacter terrae]|uniref:DUF4349 domain-containing protein n=1 Tax=Mucilaginibacter terrae TaxID=1955052 RepID=A0ABU3GU98_9SPHI|nr:DUF4349 domain-containing protein [Mucilaginibacter terrae]MDT3403347.1 hypothetical protein [Mucilaginibacter terrae]
MIRLLYAVFFITSLGACQSGGKQEGYKVQEVALAPAPPAQSSMDEAVAVDAIKMPPPVEDKTIEKKIIKEGSIAFETNDLKATRKIITDSLKKHGGYVAEETETNNNGADRKEYTLSVRIPAQNFEKFLSTVSASADRIESKNITVKDVTTEFIDVTTRLNNQKLLENRYKELLQKSTRMSDILEVENKLNEIRTNIETTQGQLNYLNKQIAYSSLNITFFTETPIKGTDGNGFGYRFKSALSESVELLQSIFFGLITSWPVVLIVIVLWFLFRRWRRKRRVANS